jgi:hypothetical protein
MPPLPPLPPLDVDVDVLLLVAVPVVLLVPGPLVLVVSSDEHAAMSVTTAVRVTIECVRMEPPKQQ